SRAPSPRIARARSPSPAGRTPAEKWFGQQTIERRMMRRFLLLPVLLLALAWVPGPAHAQTGAEPELADWRLLAGLDYTSGEMTDALRKLDGKRVKVPGYMVPLDDSARGVTEF